MIASLAKLKRIKLRKATTTTYPIYNLGKLPDGLCLQEYLPDRLWLKKAGM